MSSDEDQDGIESDDGESFEGSGVDEPVEDEEGGDFLFGATDADDDPGGTGAVADSATEPDESIEGAPFSEAAREAQRRQNAPPSPDDPFDEAFTEIDVDTIDTDSIWEELESDVDDPFGTADETAFGEGTRTVHVISKRSFCQRCRYFSEPPEVHCNHEGTEIIEAVDDDRFRVTDCPMVLDDDSTVDMNE